jgi:hypothetical protein
VLGAAFITAVALVGVLIVLILGRVPLVSVTGRLFGVRDVSFIEGSQSEGGISPVCGCEHPHLDRWRGVSFASREVTLQRTGRSPWTEWVLSSADPNQIELQGGTDATTIEAIRLKPDKAFDPRWLLEGKLARNSHVLSRASFSGYRLTLLTHQPLRLALLGPVPIAAWIPFPGSRVSLGQPSSQFPQEPQPPQLVESYPPSIGPSSRTSGMAAEQQAYPVGDFLGPDLIIWTADPAAQMPATPISDPTQPGVITVLVIKNDTFSTRIGVVPLTDTELAGRYKTDAERPRLAQQNVFFGRYDGGHVTVTVNSPLSRGAYDRVRRWVMNHPTVWIHALGNPFELAPEGAPVPEPSDLPPPPEPYSQQERYPPLPPYAGFNVFGPLKKVLFTDVWGNVAAGTQPINLSASANLLLEDVHGLRNSDNEELLSAPLATASESAHLQFRAVGRIKVNGSAQGSFLQQHSELLTAITIALAVIGFLFSLFTFLADMRRHTPAS